jgi:hypothetical protein
MNITAAKYFTIRVSLEPSDDAQLRAFCDANGMTYAMCLRLALKHMFNTMPKSSRNEISDRRQIYGRLGKNSFSVRLTSAERAEVSRFARMLNIQEKRSFSRLSRHAIKLYLSACADASRQAQSPELASSDSPLPSAS